MDILNITAEDIDLFMGVFGKLWRIWWPAIIFIIGSFIYLLITEED